MLVLVGRHPTPGVPLLHLSPRPRQAQSPPLSPHHNPLTALLEKNTKFVWSDKCQASFDELKKRLTNSVLILPDLSKNFSIYFDFNASVLDVFLCKKEE